MQQNWYRTSCCHKLTALTIITTYFVILILVHDTTYVWATLGLVFLLFVTTFSCASSSRPFLLNLRGTRVTGITNRVVDQVENEEPMQTETRIWMTDIPPSYSFVMADIPPPTPPPSYGSAILMFPPPYIAFDTKSDGDSVDGATMTEGLQVRRPLSVSTEVSVADGTPENIQLGGISFSTQVSVISGSPDTPPTVRTRFFISRQISREDAVEENNSLRPEQLLSEVHARLVPLSRHPKEDNGEEDQNSGQEQGRVGKRAIAGISRQVSREDGSEAIDVQKLMKHDLRRRVLLSRQASRDDARNGLENQKQERCENDKQPSSEDVVDDEEKKRGEARTVIVLTRQNSIASNAGTTEDQRAEQVITETAIQFQACGSAVYITIPEEVKENKDKNT